MSEPTEDKIAKHGAKFLLGLFVYIFTTGVVVCAAAFWWGAHSYNSTGPLDETKLVSIERGTGLNQIASLLESEGAINNRYLFIIGTRVLGAATDLKAGEYELDAGISAHKITQKLRNHDVFGRRITIREGLTSFEIVRLLTEVDNLSGEVTDIPKEGSLLPNTYDYRLEESREAILLRMSSAMVQTISKFCALPEMVFSSIAEWYDEPCERTQQGKAIDPLKTIGDILTLASIIEKETAVAAERRKVAGVFINRLKRGIPLQTDPTVIYAITKGKHKNNGKGPLGRRLLRKDLKYTSPYNTYKNLGLPPGPIANSGKASIEAALNPEEHDYIFFVADGTGGHVFAKTLREHNNNVAKWRKIRREQSKK